MDKDTKKLIRYIDENLGFSTTAPSRQRLREMFPEAFRKITRPRQLKDSAGIWFRIGLSNRIESSFNQQYWTASIANITKERADIFCSLFLKPTEEVDECE